MQIEDLKWWMWAVLGIFAGLLFSALLSWRGPEFDSTPINPMVKVDPMDTMDTAQFEHLAFAWTKYSRGDEDTRGYYALHHKDQPLIKSVVVHPPLKGDVAGQYWITGKYYEVRDEAIRQNEIGSPVHTVEHWMPFKYPAPTPYIPGYAQPGAGTDKRNWMARANSMALQADLGGKSAASFPTVMDYLKAIKGLQGSQLKYRFAWEELPAAVWTLPPVAGFLIIGCAWPLTLGILQNWGVARKPRALAKPAPKPVISVKVPSASGVSMRVPEPPPPPPKPTDTKKYGGEFYPVAKTGQKDH